MREFALMVFAVMGGGLFGLDIGVVGSVINMRDFKERFEDDVWTFGLISSGMNLGAFLFCWTAGPLSERFGRRNTIGLAALLFSAFAVVQGLASDFGTMLMGRVLSGGTIAICATVVPMYVSELAPAERRGALVSLQQSAIGFSIMLIYWIAWGIKDNAGSGLLEDWRVCFYVSGVPGLVLGAGVWFLPKSPRWLLARRRDDEALASLQRIRRPGYDVRKELDELKDAVVRHKTYEGNYAECAALCGRDATIRRIAITAFLVQLFQQIQGINVIMYFGPMVVDGFGLDGNLFTGIVQTFNFGFTFISVCTVDRVGRRALLLTGTGIMLFSLTLVGILGVTDSTTETDDEGDTSWVLRTRSLGYVCVACFVLYLAAFAATWGPVGWLIPSEIFPMRHRENGMVLAAYANWSSNALLGLFFPFMMRSAGFNTYFLFSFNCVLALVFVYWMLPETKGVPLEKIELLFAERRSGRGTAGGNDARVLANERLVGSDVSPHDASAADDTEITETGGVELMRTTH